MYKNILYIFIGALLLFYSTSSSAFLCEGDVTIDALGMDQTAPNILEVSYTTMNPRESGTHFKMRQSSSVDLSTPTGRGILSLLEMAMDQLYYVNIYTNQAPLCSTFNAVEVDSIRALNTRYIYRPVEQ